MHARGTPLPPANPEPSWEDPATQLQAVHTQFPLTRRVHAGHAWESIDTGEGSETLLLLPGALGVAETSFAYILAFAPTYRVISLNYPPAIADVESLTAGIAALLQAEGVGAAHVVGGSFSGFVAQYLAAWQPACIASLLLSNTGAPSPRRNLRYGALARLLALMPERMVHALMQRRIRSFLPEATPVQTFWRAYFLGLIPQFSRQALVNRLRLQAAMDSARLGRALEARPWQGPVLIVDAGEDGLITAHDRARLAARMPQAQVVTLADRGHVASLDATQTYITIYREFLCALPGADGGATG